MRPRAARRRRLPRLRPARRVVLLPLLPAPRRHGRADLSLPVLQRLPPRPRPRHRLRPLHDLQPLRPPLELPDPLLLRRADLRRLCEQTLRLDRPRHHARLRSPQARRVPGRAVPHLRTRRGDHGDDHAGRPRAAAAARGRCDDQRRRTGDDVQEGHRHRPRDERRRRRRAAAPGDDPRPDAAHLRRTYRSRSRGEYIAERWAVALYCFFLAGPGSTPPWLLSSSAPPESALDTAVLFI
mmetsp:Transcript_18538/g.74004  ORF Transcript_18538/g.74004 Transcript_18538/m.74004 type:complete len:239 (+) Transcript_18538:1260-1976(+)